MHPNPTKTQILLSWLTLLASKYLSFIQVLNCSYTYYKYYHRFEYFHMSDADSLQHMYHMQRPNAVLY